MNSFPDQVIQFLRKLFSRVPKKRKIFIICPVRKARPEIEERIRTYVAELEAEGCEVHWPARDTVQTDPHGMNICLTNCDRIIAADEIHIWFVATEGSDFDRGMLFVLLRIGFRKKVVLINHVAPVPHKNFKNVFLDLAGGRDISRKDIQVKVK